MFKRNQSERNKILQKQKRKVNNLVFVEYRYKKMRKMGHEDKIQGQL